MVRRQNLLDATRTSKEWVEEYARNGRPVWDKLPSETIVAFGHFVNYRDMGPERSLRDLSRRMSKDDRDTVNTTLAAHSSKHCWIIRAKAFDAHMEGAAIRSRKLERQTMEPRYWDMRREKVREKRYRLAELILEKAHEVVTSEGFLIKTPEDAKRWIDWALGLADKSTSTMDKPTDDQLADVIGNAPGFNPEDLSDKDLFKIAAGEG